MRLKNLAKIYPNGKGLKNLSLDFPKTGIVAVLGTNGSGKSTLFKLLLDLFEPSSGNIYHRPSKMAYVPERRALHLDLTVKEHFKLIASLRKIDKSVWTTIWKKLDRIFQLDDIARQKIMTLSKGNQQKVQFALAWMADPDCLILDEPFTGLDFTNIRLLKKAIVDEYQKGKLILISSHQYEEVEDIFTHVLILKDGSCVLFESLQHLHAQQNQYEVTLFPDPYRSHRHEEGFEFLAKEGNACTYRINDFQKIKKLFHEESYFRIKVQKISLKGLVESSID